MWAKANGYDELRTPNDERNAPIRHLNEEFGYRPTVGRIYLKGPPPFAKLAGQLPFRPRSSVDRAPVS